MLGTYIGDFGDFHDDFADFNGDFGRFRFIVWPLQKSFTASLKKNEYQFIKSICVYIYIYISIRKNNQQNMFVTLIDTRFLSLCDVY